MSIDTLLLHSPLQALFRWWNQNRLAVLAYHGIEDPKQFESHLEWFERHAHPIGLDALESSIETGKPLPRRSVLLTFDDGARSVLEEAAPRMSRKGIPGVVFIVTELLDSERPLWTDEARYLLRQKEFSSCGAPALQPEQVVKSMKTMSNQERLHQLDELRIRTQAQLKVAQLKSSELLELEKLGIEVGSHTVSHPCLDQCEPEEVWRELLESHQTLADILGKPPRSFAYPNGNLKKAFLPVVARAGYKLAFAFDHQLASLPPAEPLKISRLRVNSTTSLPRFQLILSGLHPALHKARGRN